MWEYNYTQPPCDSDELYHYGVIGMKWGIRRERNKTGRVDRNYSKASRKLDKLDRKATKKGVKAHKKALKAERKKYGLFANKDSIAIANRRAERSEYKANKAAYRTKKWVDEMNRAFAGTTPGMTPKQIALGKQYEKQLAEYEKRLKYRSDLQSIAGAIRR